MACFVGKGCHQSPKTCCIRRLVPVIPAQQQAPMARGRPPVLMSLTMSVLSPMAAIERTMKNLLRVLMGENTEASTPKWMATVVMREAAMK